MIQNKSLIKAIVFVSSGLILFFTGIQSTLAQTEPQYQRNERDSFSGGDTTGDVNPLDIINNAIIAPSRTVDEFNEDSRGSIQQAADEFKRQREQLLLNSLQESSPETNQE